ncbi:hypothetical protein PTSG_02306 [Salpingoeca rosetta]|uniref:C3H1-type domain-containing protein n=1 Tax=Salpingoeca rosetta (strain ATCC 50818 / BSB-021) TaxID=946362 RepID=F2U1T9_SALR5|nr:uncharacterized protein PTSG_02306 [Salpingoeca rosetta]EGD81591.1 hypothetical protein PTSG_02306 [Salpingoeca rosetta]|eukprot:XP_004996795.1 hypothetical protein PTSG_02306 [Salpingoeca rosetta]
MSRVIMPGHLDARGVAQAAGIPEWCTKPEDICIRPTEAIVDASGPVDEYLTQVLRRIKAEFKAFYDDLDHDYPTRYIAKVRLTGGSLTVTDMKPEETVEERVEELEKFDAGDFQYHMLKYKGAFYIAFGQRGGQSLSLVPCGPPSSQAGSPRTGWAALALQPEEHDNDHALVLDYSYVGDIIAQAQACRALLERGEHSALLTAVADPSQRTVVPYNHRNFSEDVPINEAQQTALRALRYNVEAVRGPPGTGKSTTIYHLVKSVLDPSGITIVTCVQNKAVEAVAEKLRQGSIEFFVVGNYERLSPMSRKCTLEQRVKQDPRVKAMERKIRRLKFFLEKVIRPARQANVVSSNARHQRYRQHRANELFGTVSLTDARSAAKHRWLANDPWDRFWRAWMRHRHPQLEVMEQVCNGLIQRLSTECIETIQDVRLGIVSSVRAILCTAASAASRLPKLESDFDVDFASRVNSIVLDEAGTCPEACVTLLLHACPHTDRIIAIGDNKQLPSFSRIRDVKNACHDFAWNGSCRFGDRCRFRHVTQQGFFHRLATVLRGGSGVHQLTVQYRMHASICGMVSRTFYGGTLVTPGSTARDRSSQDRHGLWWIETSAAAKEQKESKSYVNQDECHQVQEALMKLQDEVGRHGFEQLSVKVITFYKKQRKLMADVLRQSGFRVHTSDDARQQRRRRRRRQQRRQQTAPPDEFTDGDDEVDEEEDDAFKGVQVQTVDESQGSESDVVILSCVRCNDHGNVGFVSMRNRMNVACSRARYRLVIVGNSDTLKEHSHQWRMIHRHCRRVHSAQELSHFGRPVVDLQQALADLGLF